MGLPAIVPIWQYHVAQADGDGTRYMFTQNDNFGQGWTRDQVAWYALATGDSGPAPIYQYHREQSDEEGWRYTYSLSASLGDDWILDGVAWYGFASACPGGVPVYRYYQEQANGDPWRYTFSTDPNLGNGWTRDEVAFYCLSPTPAATQDYGVRIASPGNVVIPANAAYDFGTGDFSVTALFQTTSPGTLVSRKSTEGGSSANAGWLVVLNPEGSIKFATDNGFGYYKIDSGPTPALDGQWHHVAAIRRAGTLELWLDGAMLTSQAASTLPTPLDVSSGVQRVMIGGTDQVQESHNQFVGTAEDVTLWNVAIGTGQMTASMFNLLTGQETGLVGFWPMDNSFADNSPTGNAGAGNGQVSFVPVFHARWVQAGKNAFSFVLMENLATAGVTAAPPAQGATGPTVTRTQTLTVAAGAPFLVVSISDPAQLQFPAGVQLAVLKPDGTGFTQNQDTADLYVRMQGSSVWQMVVCNPAAGAWTATVTAPASAPFRLWFHTLPSADVVATMNMALAPVYGYDSGPTPGRTMHAAEYQEGVGPALFLAATALGGLAIMFAMVPGTQPVAVLTAATAVLMAAAGRATSWLESASSANLTPDQAGQQAAATALFAPAGPTPPSRSEVYAKVVQKVGDPATTDPTNFVSRSDMGIDSAFLLHLDIGGEGPSTAYDIPSGFAGALNANAQRTNSQTGNAIPMLVHLNDWSTNPPYPFQNGTVNYVTMQGAPLTEHNVKEIARILAPQGSVGLWIAPGQLPESGQSQTNLDRAVELAGLLCSSVQFSCAGPDTPPTGYTCASGCVDETNGAYPYTKICISDGRTP